MPYVPQTPDRLKHCKEVHEKAYIKMLKDALRISGGNVSQMALYLDISRPTLIRHLKKYFGPNYRTSVFAQTYRPKKSNPASSTEEEFHS